MLGNEVTVFLRDPIEQMNGTLNRQDEVGVWILHGLRHGQMFFPQHRIIRIEDRGYRPR